MNQPSKSLHISSVSLSNRETTIGPHNSGPYQSDSGGILMILPERSEGRVLTLVGEQRLHSSRRKICKSARASHLRFRVVDGVHEASL